MKASLLTVFLAVSLVIGTAAHGHDGIVAGGSSTVGLFAEAVGAEFAKGGHGSLEYRLSHTGSGIKAFCGGVGTEFPDIAGASRAVKPEEAALCEQNGVGAVTEIKFGMDAIVVVAEGEHAEEIPNFTSRHLWLAMAAQVPVNGVLVANPHKNWSDIDPAFPAEPIELLVPPEGSGTEDMLDQKIINPACLADPAVQALDQAQREDVCEAHRDDGALIEVEREDEMLEAMDELEHAMGIAAFAAMTTAAGDNDADDVMLTIDGVAPSAASIADGSYKAARPLFIYVKNAHLDQDGIIKDYVTEFVSDEAIGDDGYLVKLGLVPLPADERKAAQALAAGLSATN